MAKEPSLRKEIRRAFKNFGAVTVHPTDVGSQQIDEMHPFYAFKYLLDKPVDYFRNSPQFLQILQAENEGLITIDIHIGRDQRDRLTKMLYEMYLTDYESADAKEWNRIRERVVIDALQNHLLPMGARYIRDWLRETEEDFIANRCSAKLEEVGYVAPVAAVHADKSRIGSTRTWLRITRGQSKRATCPALWPFRTAEVTSSVTTSIVLSLGRRVIFDIPTVSLIFSLAIRKTY